MLRTLLVLLAALLPAWAAAQTLTVSAAASLADALRETGRRFEAANPGVTLRWNFAASGVLVQQILQGAPADVFLSADQVTMDRGIAGQAIDATTRRDIARNALVMVAPAGSVAPRTLADLAQADVRRIAIGKPATVPAGRYARQALEAAQLWAPLQPKLVPADNVRQVLDYVSRGEVEAGFVYGTDAALQRERLRIVLTAIGHEPITYPAAAVAGSRHPALARAFLAHLGTAESRAVFARFGFGAP
jgi:molybdate transport system substrate-binding protein